MKAHNLESNFTFLKSLKINSELGYSKFIYYDLITLKEQEKMYRMIQYKKDANQYRIGYQKNKLTLTEYNSNIATTLKL
jgi:hypothetical protein